MNTEKFVGCEVEITKSSNGCQLIDLNPGTVGGAALISSFAAGESEAMRQGVRRIAETRVERNGGLFVSGIGAYTALEVNGKVRVAPLVQEIERVAQDRGQKVKGVLARRGTFPKDVKSWERVTYAADGSVTELVFDAGTIDDLAATPAFCMNCSFAPPCKSNDWSARTRRDGLVNHILDLPSMQPAILGGLGNNSPYSNAVLFSLCKKGKDINLQGVSGAARSVPELGERLEDLKGKGYEFIAVKDAGGISIGGRGVKFFKLEQPDQNTGLFLLRLEDRISSPAVITPYVFPEVTETDKGKAIIQSRISYVPGAAGIEPAFISAKIYYCNGEAKAPMNTSSYCPEVAVWDLQDRVSFMTFPERGKCELRSVLASEAQKLVRFFEEVLQQGVPLISKVEDCLQGSFGDYESANSACEATRKKGLLPNSAWEWINLFRYSSRKPYKSVEEWQNLS